MKNEFPKTFLLPVLIAGFLFSVSCTNSQASNPTGNESPSQPSRSTASKDPAIAMLTGIWKLDAALGTGTDQLREMGDLRYEFKGNSRVRIYRRDGHRIEWIENFYSYSPQQRMLIIEDPREYRGTTQLEIIPKDVNTFVIESLVKGGSYSQPRPLKVAQAISLVRTGEAAAFEKEIENGASLSGEPLEKIPTAMTPAEKLIGTWSFAALEDKGYLSAFTPNVDFPALQIRLGADGKGSLLSQDRDSVAEIQFQFMILPASRQIFLFESGQAVFSILKLGDFDDKKMMITSFDPRYLKTTAGDKVYSSSDFNNLDSMQFVKIAEADALDQKQRPTKTGIATDYRSGVDIDSLKPLVITMKPADSSPEVTMTFDRARTHCKLLSAESFLVEDKQIQTVTENSVRYQIEDIIRLNLIGPPRDFRYPYYRYAGTMEVEKTIRQLDQAGQPISKEPQGHVSISLKDISNCAVKKTDGKFSRTKFELECSGLEAKSLSGKTIQSIAIATTCETKR